MGSLWPTTGMYPQSITIAFPNGGSHPSFVRVWTSGVAELALSAVSVSSPETEPSLVSSRSLDAATANEIQMEVFDLSSALSPSTDAVQLTISAGFGPFSAVHSISLE